MGSDSKEGDIQMPHEIHGALGASTQRPQQLVAIHGPEILDRASFDQ